MLLLSIRRRHVSVGHASRYGLLAGMLHEKLRFMKVLLLLLANLGQARCHGLVVVDFHDVIVARRLFGLAVTQHVLYVGPADGQRVSVHVAVITGMIAVWR